MRSLVQSSSLECRCVLKRREKLFPQIVTWRYLMMPMRSLTEHLEPCSNAAVSFSGSVWPEETWFQQTARIFLRRQRMVLPYVGLDASGVVKWLHFEFQSSDSEFARVWAQKKLLHELCALLAVVPDEK